jgi:hypothetical protein
MELPKQPIDTDFDSALAYIEALRACERVCMAIIEAENKEQP